MIEDVLGFWFDEIEPSKWWQKDNHFDQLIRQRFADLHAKAVLCELFHWRTTAKGKLAEIIVLDQFSRNIYRDSARSFSSDPQALSLAQEAIAVGADKELSIIERSFLYLPFMHSESALIHQLAVSLYAQQGLENNLAFELKHKTIIDRFERYPHRNNILGRQSTAAELEFLTQPQSSF